jgi:VanZ family protein
MKSSLIRWLLLFLWAAIIFAMSSAPNIFVNLPAFWYTRIIYRKVSDSYLELYEIVGVLSHFGTYMVLSALFSWALMGHGKEKKSLLLVVFALSLLYAFYDEIFQTKIPGRGFQISDLIFNALGIVTGLALYYQIHKQMVYREETVIIKTRGQDIKRVI